MPFKDPEIRRAKQREYAARYYAAHRQAAIAASGRVTRANRAYIKALKNVPCADCGGRFPDVCMDFDHVRGTKVAGIGVLVARANRAALDEELAKCEVVCANCHRIRTAERSAHGSVVTPA